MIVCEENTLSTKDLWRTAVASEISQNNVKERIGLLLASMASVTKAFITSLFLPISYDCKPTMVLKINACVSIFHRILDRI